MLAMVMILLTFEKKAKVNALVCVPDVAHGNDPVDILLRFATAEYQNKNVACFDNARWKYLPYVTCIPLVEPVHQSILLISNEYIFVHVPTCGALVMSVKWLIKKFKLCPERTCHFKPCIEVAILDAAMVLDEYVVNVCSKKKHLNNKKHKQLSICSMLF